MKIAMFAPYIAAPGGGLPNYYEYWQKTAATNSQIDFFVVTNLDISKYKKYENIHYICLTADEFWDKVQSLFDFSIERSYYKSGEYRPLFGLIFEEYIREYDFYGFTEFDVLYGDITKFVQPYIDKGADVIGEAGTLRLVRNTKEMRAIPLLPITGFEHPLTLEIAYSSSYCWYFDEQMGMGVRYYQHGITPISLENVFADIAKPFKSLRSGVLEGDLGIAWENGKLISYNAKGESKELIAAHFQKRQLAIDSELPGKTFCIVPNRIINDCTHCTELKVPTLLYALRYYRDMAKKALMWKRVGSPEYRAISAETHKYCEEVGILPKRGLFAKAFFALRRVLFWR